MTATLIAATTTLEPTTPMTDAKTKTITARVYAEWVLALTKEQHASLPKDPVEWSSRWGMGEVECLASSDPMDGEYNLVVWDDEREYEDRYDSYLEGPFGATKQGLQGVLKECSDAEVYVSVPCFTEYTFVVPHDVDPDEYDSDWEAGGFSISYETIEGGSKLVVEYDRAEVIDLSEYED